VRPLPGGDSVKGRAAIEQLMRDRFSRTGPVVDGTLTQDNLVAAGSMIYEWGHAELEMGGRGTLSPARVTARYLTVWQRDASGRWRIIRNLSLGN
jgi:ketosteroid isomerase-like protein